MNKKLKIFIIIIVILAVIVAAALVARKMVIDYLFDKAYKGIMNGSIGVETFDISGTNETVVSEDGKVYELADETEVETKEIKGEDGKTYTVKKHAVRESREGSSGTDQTPRIKRISELTKQEMTDIQNMVSTADKATVLSICKSAATAEDRKEIKEMIEDGNVDFGRIRSILSTRLTAEQKAQIYSYYEKYAKIYFGVE